MTSNQHGPYVRGYTRVTMAGTETVSYTHLDVYKRQAYDNGKTGTAQRAGSKTIAAAFGRDRRERVNIWESMC